MQGSRKSPRQLKDMTARLMVHTRDIERYQVKLRDEEISLVRLSQYVDKCVAGKIIDSKDDVLLQDTKQESAILFANIRAFTTIRERMAPEDVIEFLNTYFDAMVRIIFSHQGILDKFIGDELMATFGAIGEAKVGP